MDIGRICEHLNNVQAELSKKSLSGLLRFGWEREYRAVLENYDILLPRDYAEWFEKYMLRMADKNPATCRNDGRMDG
jgi:hypothetical protein